MIVNGFCFRKLPDKVETLLMFAIIRKMLKNLSLQEFGVYNKSFQ